jgi:hypothetical protein
MIFGFAAFFLEPGIDRQISSSTYSWIACSNLDWLL